MSSTPIVIDPTDDKPEISKGYEPLDPASFQWQPGTNVEITTRMDIDGNKVDYKLTVIKPLTFDELTALVRNALQQTGSELFVKLFNTWFANLQKINLLDAESFKAAAAKSKAPADAHKAKGNGNSAA